MCWKMKWLGTTVHRMSHGFLKPKPNLALGKMFTYEWVKAVIFLGSLF